MQVVRTIIDLIDSLTYGLRMIVGMLCLFVFCTVGVIAFTASRVADNATENLASKAGTMGERAISAKLAAEREKALAEDGWGYGAATGSDTAWDETSE